MKIAVHFATGFEEIEAVTIVDVLRRAKIETLMVSVADRRIVTGAHNIQLACDTMFEELDYSDVDMILLPGGMPGSANLKNHQGLKKEILNFSKDGKPLGAICAAPMVLGELGLLKGKDAVCYPGFEEHLKGARIQDEKVVQSGDFITAKGPGAAIEFALKVVSLLKDQQTADSLRKDMIAE